VTSRKKFFCCTAVFYWHDKLQKKSSFFVYLPLYSSLILGFRKINSNVKSSIGTSGSQKFFYVMLQWKPVIVICHLMWSYFKHLINRRLIDINHRLLLSFRLCYHKVIILSGLYYGKITWLTVFLHLISTSVAIKLKFQI